jgi:hypothetical protein
LNVRLKEILTVRKFLLASAACVIATSAAQACAPTLKQYQSARVGDTYNEVVAKFTCQGKELWRMSILDNSETVSYNWQEGEMFEPGWASATVSFTDGRLSSKSSTGLRDDTHEQVQAEPEHNPIVAHNGWDEPHNCPKTPTGENWSALIDETCKP